MYPTFQKVLLTRPRRTTTISTRTPPDCARGGSRTIPPNPRHRQLHGSNAHSTKDTTKLTPSPFREKISPGCHHQETGFDLKPITPAADPVRFSVLRWRMTTPAAASTNATIPLPPRAKKESVQILMGSAIPTEAWELLLQLVWLATGDLRHTAPIREW